MALMARHLGYPSRVVMGFAPEVARTPTRSRWSAATSPRGSRCPSRASDGSSFRPTPDQVDVPQEQTPKPKSEPQPQVRQPPRAEHVEDELLTTVEIDDTDDDRDRPFQLPGVGVGHPRGGRHPRRARAPADARRRAREAPAPRRRRSGANRAGRGRVGGARRPVRRARLRAAGAGHALQAARALERQLAEQGLAAPARPGADAATAAARATLAATIDRDVFGGGDVSDAVVEDRWRRRMPRQRPSPWPAGPAAHARGSSRYRLRRRRRR